jgi:hypothetical protein
MRTCESAPALRQAEFVQSHLLSIVSCDIDYEDYIDMVTVVGEHRSKSVVLPVYEMRREDFGLRLVMRNNWYNWKLSVDRPRGVVANFSGLFHTTPPIEPEYTGDDLHPAYFEGFRREDVFGYYSESSQRFSANIGGDFAMWASVFEIARSIGIVKPLQWRTRASHEKEICEAAERRKSRST